MLCKSMSEIAHKFLRKSFTLQLSFELAHNSAYFLHPITLEIGIGKIAQF